MNFTGNRLWFFLVSFLVIAPGIVFLVIAPGLNPGIDFTGGSAIMIEFADPVEERPLTSELSSLGHVDSRVDRMEDGTFFIRTKEITGDEKNAMLDAFEANLSPGGVEVLSFDLVSPAVASEMVTNALWIVIAGAVGIFLYVWWAFRNVPGSLRYGAAAILALIHDVTVVLGIFAILGVLADVEVSTMFMVALLTVIGYSVNDTIVVFDRLRENVLLYPTRKLEANVNLSIFETLGRSLNTSLTILFPLVALMLFGGTSIRVFLLVLLIGVVAGTYSSIAIAAQTLVVWDNGDVGRLLGRRRSGSASVSA